MANTSHPCAHGSTLAVEPGPRIPLSMPRQQHMVMGQRLGNTAGHRDDIQRCGRGNSVAWSDNRHGRSLGNPFASAIAAQTMRPNWSDFGIFPVPCVPSKRLGFVSLKPLLRWRRDLGHLRPIHLSRTLLGLLLGQ